MIVRLSVGEAVPRTIFELSHRSNYVRDVPQFEINGAELTRSLLSVLFNLPTHLQFPNFFGIEKDYIRYSSGGETESYRVEILWTSPS